VVVVQSLFVSPAAPGGFGLSRWISGFINIVGLPALVPLIVCGALVILRVFPRDANYADFALLWLVPLAAIRSITNSPPTPLPLIIVPLLWVAQVIGIPFFIDVMVKNPRRHIVFFAVIGIAAIPIAANTSWWAFFSQQTFWGIVLLIVSLVPAVISFCVDLTPQPTDYTEILNREWKEEKTTEDTEEEEEWGFRYEN